MQGAGDKCRGQGINAGARISAGDKGRGQGINAGGRG